MRSRGGGRIEVLDEPCGLRHAQAVMWGRTQLAILSSLCGLCACQPGATTAELVRPDAPTANDVVADTVPCRDRGSYAEPLIVDWSSSGRLDLEFAMKRGVAVVAYDCQSLRLLNGCSLPASYAFAGVTVKEEVIQLANADEISANLPLSGVKLAAGMDARSSLDLALVMVGKRSTALRQADKTMLEGECEGATHYVRAATMGAFAMARGSRGEVKAAADLFGAEVKAGSQAQRSAKTMDGDRGSCAQSQPEDTAPPPGCGASLRLELVPIAAKPAQGQKKDAEGKGKAEGDGAEGQVATGCPAGMTQVGGKCVDGGAELALCDDRDRGACRRLCKRGSAYGCLKLGEGLMWRKGKREEGLKQLRRACDLGNEDGCARVAAHLKYSKDEKEQEAGVALAKASCKRGGAASCTHLAYAALTYRPAGEADPEEEAAFHRYAQRACDLGDQSMCSARARRLVEKPETEAEGFALYRRACEAGDKHTCQSWGWELRKRNDGPGYVEAYSLGCKHGGLWMCGEAALPKDGLSIEDVERSDGAQRALARRGCFEGDDTYACRVLVQRGKKEDWGKAARHGCHIAWAKDDIAYLCGRAADHAAKRARTLDVERCEDGNTEACHRSATRFYARACEAGEDMACMRLRYRDGVQYRRLVMVKCEDQRFTDEKWCERAKEEGMKVRPKKPLQKRPAPPKPSR